jgi:hypothetical protein
MAKRPNLKLRKHQIEPLQMFGHWKALEEAPNDVRNRRQWRVRCICGKVAVRGVRELVTGKTRSCGCVAPAHLGANMKELSRQRLIIQEQYGKKCGTCHERKPLEEFSRNRAMRDGHCQDCKDCTKLKLREAYYRRTGMKPGEKRMGKAPVPIPPGTRFGKLIVLREREDRRTIKRDFDLVCDCGEEVLVSIDQLTRGKATSCGCHLTGKARQLHMAKKARKVCSTCGEAKRVGQFLSYRLGSGINRRTVHSDECKQCQQSRAELADALNAANQPVTNEVPPWARS